MHSICFSAGARWDHKEGITLVGEAAHLMSPLAGEGVNLAFENVMKLASNVTKRGSKEVSLEAKIVAYEEDMFTRARRAQIHMTEMMQDMYFTKGASRAAIES